MTDSELLDAVRLQAGLDTERAAERATLAVLRRLLGRLSYRGQLDLGSRLPPRIRRAAQSAPGTDLRFAPAATFVRDVAEELYVTRAQAREDIRAVGAVLGKLLAPDEMQDLRAELHGTYQAIFETGIA